MSCGTEFVNLARRLGKGEHRKGIWYYELGRTVLINLLIKERQEGTKKQT